MLFPSCYRASDKRSLKGFKLKCDKEDVHNKEAADVALKRGHVLGVRQPERKEWDPGGHRRHCLQHGTGRRNIQGLSLIHDGWQGRRVGQGSVTLVKGTCLDLGVNTHSKYPGQVSPFPKREAS